MEVNLRRMNDYIKYEENILRILFNDGHITEEQFNAGFSAMTTLLQINASVKGGKAADGHLTIVSTEGQ